jgi:hypothetical protein
MDPGVAIEYIKSFAGKKYDPEVSAALAAAFADGQIKLTRTATMV